MKINLSSDTKKIIKAMEEIAAWCHTQAADAKEDADHRDHTIRALALNEAVDRMKQLEKDLHDLDLYRGLVFYISNDYLELSYNKAEWQRNDWRKRADKLIQRLEKE